MSPEEHLTPWGETFTALSRVTGLKRGEGVYHPTFRKGLVENCEGTGDEERAAIHFQWHGLRLLALAFAPLCRMPDALAEKCRNQANWDWHSLARKPTPHDELVQLLGPAPASSLWFKSIRRWQIPMLPPCLDPVPQRLPYLLPWACAPTLVGPKGDTWASNAWYASRRERRARRSIHLTEREPGMPLYVCGAMPPFKRLRFWLSDAVQAMHWVGPEVVSDILTCWNISLQNTGCEVDLTCPLPGGLYRYGTRLFLNRMRARLVDGIQQLRAISFANGCWWPAPERIQILLNADGTIAARLQFVQGYRRTDQPWVTYSGKKGVKSRQWRWLGPLANNNDTIA